MMKKNKNLVTPPMSKSSLSEHHIFSFDENNNIVIPKEFVEETKNFRKALLLYTCAVQEVTTKFEILNAELGHLSPRNPILSIKSRVKSPDSIVKKLLRDKKEVSVNSMIDNLNDVAGVRVICSYIDDIYEVARMFAKQDDVNVLHIKDYIVNAKENGYRSYHMIVEIPVFLSEGKHYTRVEIQIRTIAMDFWASLEHEIRYKKEHKHLHKVAAELQRCADTIHDTDQAMLGIRNLIDDE